MLTKINRKDCLNKFRVFPLSSFDPAKGEEVLFYPNVFKSYILTLSSKTFKGHIKALGKELSKLTAELGYENLIFLGDTEFAWLNQNNDYKPAREAQEYLIENKIGKKFNGALQVDRPDLTTFVKHLSWLMRCNASLPYFHFSNEGQNLVGSICKYGNLHIATIDEVTDNLIKAAVKKTNYIYLDGNNCYNQFGKTSAIVGRRIIV